MKDLKLKAILFFLILYILQSCTNIQPKQIAGYYEEDKFFVKDTNREIETFSYLQLRDDLTFELRNPIGIDSISGTWRVLKSKSNIEGTIEFSFNNKSIVADVKNTIIKFKYPNDFYSGYYEDIMYVKLNRIPPNME